MSGLALTLTHSLLAHSLALTLTHSLSTLSLSLALTLTQVISRSGDECVVALTDQWYLTYGG